MVPYDQNKHVDTSPSGTVGRQGRTKIEGGKYSIVTVSTSTCQGRSTMCNCMYTLHGNS